jgi:hypothetical protein
MPAEIGQPYGRAGAVELTKEFLSRPHRDGAAGSRRQPVLVSARLWAAFLADPRDDFQAGRHAAD